jgi:outer membrane protein assembly factor BamA
LHLPAGGDWTDWRVRSLRCLGLQHADSTVILRELELRPGVGYSDELLEQDAAAVKNTNLFARLVVSVNPDSADESVDIVYAVSERPRWLAFPILTPTENLGLIYGLGLMNRNLGGLGRSLDLQAEYGERLSYSLLVQQPWFLGRRRAAQFYLARRVSDAADGDYQMRGWEARAGWSHHFDRETRLGLHPYWQEVRVRDQRAGARRATVHPGGLDIYGGAALSLEHNTTDFHVNPHRGGRQVLGLSGFGLAGRDRPAGALAHLGLSAFLPLPADLTLGASLAGDGTVGRRADYMKHYLGGRQRVRGGHNGQWPGWSLAHASVELRAPLLPRRVYFQHVDLGLGGVIFADGGVVWREVFRGPALAAGGAGLGLRLFAPFIEVGRVDLAWSPTHGLMVQIGQGHAF